MGTVAYPGAGRKEGPHPLILERLLCNSKRIRSSTSPRNLTRQRLFKMNPSHDPAAILIALPGPLRCHSANGAA